MSNHPRDAAEIERRARPGPGCWPVTREPRGLRRLSDGSVEGQDPLAPFGVNALHHVRRTDAFGNCPDLVVNGTWWPATDEVAAFEELVGSHGGMGGEQSYPFVLFPAELPFPDEPVVGACALHAVLKGWLDVSAVPARAPA